MDPIAIFSGIYDVVKLIQQANKDVEVNKNQCQRLANRVDVIATSLKFMKDTDLQRVELKKPLMDLDTCVKKCQDCIGQFKNKKSWFSKVFYKQHFKEEFEELNQQLQQCATDLNLSINLKQVFDPQQDKSDQQNDLKAIQSKLDEIATMMVQLREDQFSHYIGMKNHMDEWFKSFTWHLQQNIIQANDPVRRQKIVEEENAFLHIPYHDLLLEQQIGQGGFGDIYRGRWLSHEHEVAIKIIRIQYLGEQIKEEFIKEISTMY